MSQNEETCVVCGAVIPEGRQVCPTCNVKVEAKYKEILALERFCLEIGIAVEKESFLDGWALRFKNGGDVVQHGGSGGSKRGCVEFAVGRRIDFSATGIEKAKKFVEEYKDELNGGKRRGKRRK